MTIDDLIQRLENSGYKINTRNEVLNGLQLKLNNGSTITCYHNGRIQVQGKKVIKNEMESFLGLSNSDIPLAMDKIDTYGQANEVFVVYGHDKEARDQLEAMLRRWGLEPLILDQLPSEGQTIIEKLESYTNKAKFG